MAEHREKPASRALATLPPLPLHEGHWQAICTALRLSPRQIAVVELMLRDAGNKEIVAALGINGDNLWTLALPVHLTWSLPGDGLTVVGTLDGTITATADVPPPPVVNFPEPASWTLACVGLGLVVAWRRWRG